MNLSGFHPRSRYSRFGFDNGMPVIVAFLVRCLRHLSWKLDLLISGGFGRRPDSYQDKLDSRASYFVLCSRALVYKRRADVLYITKKTSVRPGRPAAGRYDGNWAPS